MSEVKVTIDAICGRAFFVCSSMVSLADVLSSFLRHQALYCFVVDGKNAILGSLSWSEISLFALKNPEIALDSILISSVALESAPEVAFEALLPDVEQVFLQKNINLAVVRKKKEIYGYITRGKYFEQLVWLNHQMQATNDQYLEMIHQRDDYLAIVSHDIRSPLGVISVCCDYLGITDQERPLSEEQKDFISRIKRNALKALSLVGSLLDIGRLNSGVSLDLEHIDLNPFIKAIVENVQVLGLQKKISIRVESPILLDVLIDPKRFAQVIENLLNNAIKFTPSGKAIYVVITFEPRDLNGHVSIAIRDEGFGIPSQKIKGLFEKYKQDDAKIAKELGVGLGLSIARQFTQLHKGWIEVESEEGQGSTFTVFLPNASILTKIAPCHDVHGMTEKKKTP